MRPACLGIEAPSYRLKKLVVLLGRLPPFEKIGKAPLLLFWRCAGIRRSHSKQQRGWDQKMAQPPSRSCAGFPSCLRPLEMSNGDLHGTTELWLLQYEFLQPQELTLPELANCTNSMPTKPNAWWKNKPSRLKKVEILNSSRLHSAELVIVGTTDVLSLNNTSSALPKLLSTKLVTVRMT